MATADFLAAFDALPCGSFTGHAGGKRYVVSKTLHAGGRSAKLVAEELGGSDYISLNLYRTRTPWLKPCEMPTEKVIRFVMGLVPEPKDKD